MADDSPAGRLRALKRAMPWYAGIFVALIGGLTATGWGEVAFLLAVFGLLAGAAVYDAAKSRIELQRYREAYGELPPVDEGR